MTTGPENVDDAGLNADLPAPFLALKRLGDGGEGVAWLAWDPRLSRRVILKSHPSCDSLASRAERLGSLSLPEVPFLISSIEQGPRTWWVLAHRPGIALDGLVQQMQFGASQVISVAIDLLAGIQACHNAGIVHGDVAPTNVIVDPTGCARLIDFGQAQGVGQPLYGAGTPGFSWPGQALEGLATAMTDRYSIGALLAWLVTGETPEFWVEQGEASIVVLPSRPAVMASVEPALWRVIEALLDSSESPIPIAELLVTLKTLSVQLPGGVAGARANMAQVVVSNIPDPPLPAREPSRFSQPQRSHQGRKGPLFRGWSALTNRRGLVAVCLALVPTVALSGAILWRSAPPESAAVTHRITVVALDATPTTPLPNGFSRPWLSSELDAALKSAFDDRDGPADHFDISVSCTVDICQVGLAHGAEAGAPRHWHQSTLLATRSGELWRGVIHDLVHAAAVR